MYKRVPIRITEDILEKVKGDEHCRRIKSICCILKNNISLACKLDTTGEISIIEHISLRRENEELKRIIGIMTLELERGKINRNH